MPLVLFQNDGLTNPRFHCDLCDRYIDDASKGLLLWTESDEQTQQFVPKIVCERCDRLGADHCYPLSMGLDVALGFLLKNSGIETETRLMEVCCRAARLGGI